MGKHLYNLDIIQEGFYPTLFSQEQDKETNLATVLFRTEEEPGFVLAQTLGVIKEKYGQEFHNTFVSAFLKGLEKHLLALLDKQVLVALEQGVIPYHQRVLEAVDVIPVLEVVRECPSIFGLYESDIMERSKELEAIFGLDQDQIGEVAGCLARDLGIEQGSARSFLEFLSAVFSKVEEPGYGLWGLFVEVGRISRGQVRKIFVRVDKCDTGQGRIIGYGVEDEKNVNETFREAVGDAHRIACDYTGKEYDVRIRIDGVIPQNRFSGDSLGMALALAIVAEATGQEIGIDQPGDVAVTGALYKDQTLKPIGGIEHKIPAVLGLGSELGIGHVIVPEGNRRQAQALVDQAQGEVQVHGFETLSQCFAVLFDPWKGYLEALREELKGTSLSCQEALDTHFSKKLINLDCQRSVLIDRFDVSEREKIALALASHFAQARSVFYQKGGAKLLYDSANIPPVPVVINASLEGGLFTRVEQEVRAYAPHISSRQITHELQQAGFVLIFHSLDSYEDLPIFDRRGAYSQLVSFYDMNKRALICGESTWQRRQKELREYEGDEIQEFEILWLHDGRSTFLDRHLEEVRFAFAQNKIMACNKRWVRFDTGQPSSLGAEEFFENFYLPLDVLRVEEERDVVRPVAFEEALELDPRILLLGEGGSGKSTQLLGLFFELCSSSVTDPDHRSYVPLYIDLGEMFSAGQQRTLKQFLEGKLPDCDLEAELRYTPGILFLLDGSNEAISKSEDWQATIEDIENFVLSLDRGHRVVLTSRPEPMTELSQEMWSLARLSGFQMYQLQKPGLEQAKQYLGRIAGLGGQGKEVVQELLAEIGEDNKEILESPLMIHLVSTILGTDIRERLRILGHFEDVPLNRSLLYEIAIEEWLASEREMITIEAIKKLEGRMSSPRALQRGLLEILASAMVDKNWESMTDEQVLGVLEEYGKGIIHENLAWPDWWPMRETFVGSEMRRVPLGLSFGRGNKVWFDKNLLKPVLEALKKTSLLHVLYGQVISFVHETIKEYFAAASIYEARSDPEWQEVLDEKIENYKNWGRTLHLMSGLLNSQELKTLINWCHNWQENLYGLEYLSQHLGDQDEYEQVCQLVQKPFIDAKIKIFGYEALLKDLRCALKAAERYPDDKEGILRMFEYALLYANIDLVNTNLANSGLLALGMLYQSPESVLSKIEIVKSDKIKAKALVEASSFLRSREPQKAKEISERVVKLVGSMSDQERALIADQVAASSSDDSIEIVETVAKVDDAVVSSLYLNRMAMNLKSTDIGKAYELLDLALHKAESIEGLAERFFVLTELASSFSEKWGEKAQEIANQAYAFVSKVKISPDNMNHIVRTACSFKRMGRDGQYCSTIDRVLRELSRWGPDSAEPRMADVLVYNLAKADMDWALEITKGLQMSGHRSSAYSHLACVLAEQRDPQAEVFLRQTKYALHRARALVVQARMAAAEDIEQSREIYNQAKPLVKTGTYQGGHAALLARIVPSLIPLDQHLARRMFDQAEDIAREIELEGERDRAFREIAVAMCQVDPPKAIALAEEISLDWERDSAFRYMAPLLANQYPDLALDLVSRIQNPWCGEHSLFQIAPFLGRTDPDQALKIASKIEVLKQKAGMLRNIAVVVSEKDVERAIQVAEQIPDKTEKAIAWGTISAVLSSLDRARSQEYLEKALGLVASGDQRQRWWVWRVIAIEYVHLDPSHAQPMIEMVQQIADPIERTKSLVALALNLGQAVIPKRDDHWSSQVHRWPFQYFKEEDIPRAMSLLAQAKTSAQESKDYAGLQNTERSEMKILLSRRDINSLHSVFRGSLESTHSLNMLLPDVVWAICCCFQEDKELPFLLFEKIKYCLEYEIE